MGVSRSARVPYGSASTAEQLAALMKFLQCSESDEMPMMAAKA